MFGLGFGEWILILCIAVVIFGPGFLVKSLSGLGESVRGFREGLKSGQEGQQSLPKGK